MYVVSWHAYFKSSHGKADWIFTWHGQLTKFKEPPSHMCIDCGKSNTNKEEVDKHIMCHTRGKNTIRLWTLWKGIYTVAYTNSYLWKAQLSERMLQRFTMLSNKSTKKVFSRPGKARGGSANTCPPACPIPNCHIYLTHRLELSAH